MSRSMIRAVLLLVGPALGGVAGAQEAPEPARLAPRLRAALVRSTRYLDRHLGRDGRFVYRQHRDANATTAPGYNVLRHAGSIHALVEQQRRRPTAACAAAIGRASRFLRAQIGPLPGRPQVLAVWSRPALVGREPLEAKLGGSGLGLVALTGALAVRADAVPRETLRGLGRFLCLMQHPSGHFLSRFVPSRGGGSDVPRVPYYPGEAALGLLLLHRQDPDPRWLEAAARGVHYLARRRQQGAKILADHWAMRATAALLPRLAQTSRAGERERLIEHVRQVVRVILADRRTTPDDPVCGAFDVAGRIAPTATRLEGLIAADRCLPPGDPLRPRIRAACAAGVAFLLRAQIRGGPLDGGLPWAGVRLPDGHPAATPAHRAQAGELRIDYVQHAMSAWRGYLDRFVDGR